MDKEKSLWLESIGARSFPEPVLYTYTFPGYNGCFNLSERYINDTPLEELKRNYKQNMRHVELCLNSEHYWKRCPHATDARELRASRDPLHLSASQQIQPQSHIEAPSDTAAFHLHQEQQSALEEVEKRVAPLVVPKGIS